MESERGLVAAEKAEAVRKHHRDHQAEADSGINPTHRARNPTHGQKHQMVVERIAAAKRITTAVKSVAARRKDREQTSSIDRCGLHKEIGMQ